ncbi:MAG: diguanylate cyclase domain-containing protein [Thermodesulfobacteriota bacterium]
MTLKARLLSTLFISFALMAILLSLVSHWVILNDFDQLEFEGMQSHMERLDRALTQSHREIDQTVRTWSQWEAAADFVADEGDAGSFESLLNRETMESLRLNLLMLRDASGDILFERYYDYNTDKWLEPISGTRGHLFHLARSNTTAVKKGIYALPQGPLLVSARAIHADDTRVGTLVMGRIFSEHEAQTMATLTNLDITAYDLKHPPLPDDISDALYDLSLKSPRHIEADGEGTLNGYMLIEDFFSFPALIFKISQKRSIHDQGVRAVTLLMSSFVAIFALFAVLNRFIFLRYLIRPFRLLRTDLAKIEDLSDLSRRVSIPKEEEFQSAALAINRTLSSLEANRKELTEAHERYSAVVNQSSEAIYMYDAQTKKIIYGNPAICRLLGYRYAELLQKWVYDLVQAPKAELDATIDSILAGDSYVGERPYRTKFGTLVPLEITASLVHYQGRQVVSVVGRDISERKKSEERIRYLAYHDQLTGLPNRTLFLDRLEQCIKEARRTGNSIGLFFLDLNDFKIINDCHGHKIGDRLLLEVAERLEAHLREMDTVARLGGDEFVVIVKGDATRHNCQTIARKLIQAIDNPFLLDGIEEEVQVGLSIGISIFADDAADMEEMIQHADTAMYAAKRKKHSGWEFFTPEMLAQLGPKQRRITPPTGSEDYNE